MRLRAYVHTAISSFSAEKVTGDLKLDVNVTALPAWRRVGAGSRLQGLGKPFYLCGQMTASGVLDIGRLTSTASRNAIIVEQQTILHAKHKPFPQPRPNLRTLMIHE